MFKLISLMAVLTVTQIMFGQAIDATVSRLKIESTDSNVFTTPDSHNSTSSNGIHPVEIPSNITLIDEKSLYFDASIQISAGRGINSNNGLRFYAFTLDSKEKLKLKLISENSNRIGMEILAPDKPDRMVTEFARINRMPKSLKSSRVEIKNVTDDPYTIILSVYGSTNYWYKIEINRSI